MMKVPTRTVLWASISLWTCLGCGDDNVGSPVVDASRAIETGGPVDVAWGSTLAAEAGVDSALLTEPDVLTAPSADAPVTPESTLPDQPPCNSDPALCDKRYDNVTYATTHRAMAYAFPPFPCPAQTKTVRGQLDQGIRALDFEVHSSRASIDGGAGTLAFCVGDCSTGQLPMGIALDDVKAFLDVNPREVVTLFFQGDVDAQALAEALVAARLDTFVLTHGLGDAWPTLRDMIATGTRVVVFADVSGTQPAWMLPLASYVAATSATFTSRESMTCDVALGAATAPLFRLNHFLVDGVAGGSVLGLDGGTALAPGCDDPQLAHLVNADPFFSNRVTACTQLRGSRPNFVVVDFFEDGALSFVLRALNR